ncbi:hypothetical protein Vadar_000804 [Vaccinium darrowii]|uniref:Uncharacterized protein n=1 Tax=Vaccinium darrowii TaxID=229202 RepID=A0ACB7Z0V2_9ERIC|nr:hypothetical protein Vadar_000804 [Vaccinium darrowii]
MEKQGYGYFPDDCLELIFQKLKEDDERDLDSISLVSKRFLRISNRVKHSLNIKVETLHLLPNLLKRFRDVKSIVIVGSHKDLDGLLDQIAQSGLLNLQAIKFCWCSTEPPRDGFRALGLNKNIKNNLKVLDCSGLLMQDKDLVLIADLFPQIEALTISTFRYFYDDNVNTCITDNGVDALASKLKELKEIVFRGDARFITDESLKSLSTNCVKLSKISLLTRCKLGVTEAGIDSVMRNSPNLTSLARHLRLSPHPPLPSVIGNSLTMTQELSFIEDTICLVVKARPPLKKLKLDGFYGAQYPEIYGGLKFLLQEYQFTLKELTLRRWSFTDTDISNLAQYLSNLTSINLDGHFGLTSATFYTLTKSCPLLEILTMANARGQKKDTFSSGFSHKNYRLRHLDIQDNMWVDDTTLENFGQVCPNLQFLSVGHCRRLTNVGIGEVLRSCPALKQLHICCLEVSDIFGRYSDNSVVNLKTLKARETQINDKAMAMIGNRCRNLQYLDIGSCNEVTDKGVMEVVRSCERLRDINRLGCKNVSTNILPQMVFSRPSLRKLNNSSVSV